MACMFSVMAIFGKIIPKKPYEMQNITPYSSIYFQMKPVLKRVLWDGIWCWLTAQAWKQGKIPDTMPEAPEMADWSRLTGWFFMIVLLRKVASCRCSSNNNHRVTNIRYNYRDNLHHLALFANSIGIERVLGGSQPLSWQSHVESHWVLEHFGTKEMCLRFRNGWRLWVSVDYKCTQSKLDNRRWRFYASISSKV